MAKYLTNNAFEEIRNVLANTFLNRDDAESIARITELDLPSIGFADKSIKTWDEVLSRAEIETKLIPLLHHASKYGGGISEIDTFRTSVETGKLFQDGMPEVVLSKDVKNSSVPVILLMYDNNDSAECLELKKQLYFFEMNEEAVIKTFQADIIAGDVKKQQQEIVLQADIIVPVISPDFFNPENGFLSYLRSKLEPNTNSNKMVPVLLVTCLYARVKVLKDYLTLPPFGKFIDEYANRELAYKEVAEGIGNLLEKCKTVK
jgi:hypothetical protein